MTDPDETCFNYSMRLYNAAFLYFLADCNHVISNQEDTLQTTLGISLFTSETKARKVEVTMKKRLIRIQSQSLDKIDPNVSLLQCCLNDCRVKELEKMVHERRGNKMGSRKLTQSLHQVLESFSLLPYRKWHLYFP